MCFVFCSSCSFFLQWLLLSFVLVGFYSFVADLRGLWTDAHQWDRAPQWQLPPAAGPWPVPRCLRRWSSLSAHCFFCVPLKLWIHQPFIEHIHSSLAVAQGLQGPVCTRASAVQGDSSVSLVLCCWIALIKPPAWAPPHHSPGVCIHSDRSAKKWNISDLFLLDVLWCIFNEKAELERAAL